MKTTSVKRHTDETTFGDMNGTLTYWGPAIPLAGSGTHRVCVCGAAAERTIAGAEGMTKAAA